MTYQEMMANKAKNASPLDGLNPMATNEALAYYDKTGSYERIDQEKLNANAQAHADNVAARKQHDADIARLREVNARINELTAQIAQMKSNMEFEDKYKDNPYWQLAKKQYIDTGDLSAIENFRNREEAIIEAEKNRKHALELAASNKAEQNQYNLDEAMKNRSKALLAYKAALASNDKNEIANTLVDLEYWDARVNKLNGNTTTAVNVDTNVNTNNENATVSIPEWLPGDTSETFKKRLSDKSFAFATSKDKETFRKWWDNATEEDKQATGLDPTTVQTILKKDDKETTKDKTAKAKADAQAWWNGLSPMKKKAIQEGYADDALKAKYNKLSKYLK